VAARVAAARLLRPCCCSSCSSSKALKAICSSYTSVLLLTLTLLLQRICSTNSIHPVLLLLLLLITLHPVPTRTSCTAATILLLLLLLTRRTRLCLLRELRVEVWRYRNLPVCPSLEHPGPHSPFFIKISDKLQQTVALYQLCGVYEHPFADHFAHELFGDQHLAAARCCVAVARRTVDLQQHETGTEMSTHLLSTSHMSSLGTST
jgi:hypothetical protein